jgi:release factor glutamine methyltransferase
VLIPRPETELMAERAVELLSRELPAGAKLVVDVGTGSGCIAVSIAKNLPDVTVHATDASEGALELARRNAEDLGVKDQIEFHAGELLEPVRHLAGRVSLVISNPPYIAEGDFKELAPELTYEPRGALVAGPTGLEVSEKLVASVAEMLVPGGAFLCEMGAGQAADVLALATATGSFESVKVRRDYADIERILEGRTPAEVV